MISRMPYISDFFSEKRPQPKRNYIKENIKRLQLISKSKQNESGPSKSVSASRFQRPLSEFSEQGGSGYNFRREGSNLSLNQLKLRDFLKDSHHPTGFRHQSSQTIEETELDSLYHDGVIRYPTKQATLGDTRTHTKMVRTISLQTETPTEVRPSSPSVTGSPGGDSVKDFVKLNAQVQVSPPKRRPTAPDPIRPPPHYQMGVLPKYLREQKKELESLKDLLPQQEIPPPGHVVLPDEERIKHLNELKNRYTELCGQLNALPVKMDTLRIRHKKMDIEKELERVEAGIKLFSRDKLFIQVPV